MFFLRAIQTGGGGGYGCPRVYIYQGEFNTLMNVLARAQLVLLTGSLLHLRIILLVEPMLIFVIPTSYNWLREQSNLLQ